MGRLSGEVHSFLTAMEKKNRECLQVLYKLYETFVGNCGYCNVYQVRCALRDVYNNWESDFRTPGAVSSRPPALRAKCMACYHHEGTNSKHAEPSAATWVILRGNYFGT